MRHPPTPTPLPPPLLLADASHCLAHVQNNALSPGRIPLTSRSTLSLSLSLLYISYPTPTPLPSLYPLSHFSSLFYRGFCDTPRPRPRFPPFSSHSRRPLFKPCARTRIRWRVSWHTNLPRGRDSRGRASRRVTARCHRRAVARGEGTLASHGWAGLGRDGDKRRRAA